MTATEAADKPMTATEAADEPMTATEAADEPMTATEAADEAMTRRDGGQRDGGFGEGKRESNNLLSTIQKNITRLWQ